MWIFEYIAEQKIQEAMARGEFDHLPGAGKPVELDDAHLARREDRLALHLLRRSGYLPQALAIRKEFEEFLEKAQREMDCWVERLRISRQKLRNRLPEDPEAALHVMSQYGFDPRQPAVAALCRLKPESVEAATSLIFLDKLKQYTRLYRKAWQVFTGLTGELKSLKDRAESAKIQYELSHRCALHLTELTFADFDQQTRRVLTEELQPPQRSAVP